MAKQLMWKYKFFGELQRASPARYPLQYLKQCPPEGRRLCPHGRRNLLTDGLDDLDYRQEESDHDKTNDNGKKYYHNRLDK